MDISTLSLDRKVAWYLIASYAYYELNETLMSDEDYDKICNDLMVGYDKIAHPHKKFVHLDMLVCGSGFGIEYPSIAKSAALRLIQKL